MNHPILGPAVISLPQEIPDEDRAARALRRAENRRHWRKLYPDKLRAQRRRYRVRRQARDREQVFAHYGTTCACCGTADGLTIDHASGNGAEHRREMGNRGGYRTYRWLVMNGFPPGFQSLCEPCNLSKGRGAACRIDHDGEQDGPGDAGLSLIAC